MKKLFFLLLAVALPLAACARQFGADGYASREEYLSTWKEEGEYYQQHKPSGWEYSDLFIYDAAWDFPFELAGEAPRDGRLYLIDDSGSAKLFLNENVTYFGYLRDWIVCVIDSRKFIIVDGNGRSRHTLFTAKADVTDFYCDGDVMHFLTGETLWRYYAGEKTLEQIITFPGMQEFSPISNMEYVFFAPSPEYLNALAQMTEQELDANERHFALARKGVLNSCVYYIDVRDMSAIHEYDPFDSSIPENGPPYWYEQYRFDKR